MHLPPKGPLLQRALADGYADQNYNHQNNNHNHNQTHFPQPIHFPTPYHLPHSLQQLSSLTPPYEPPSLAFPSLHQVNKPLSPFASFQLLNNSPTHPPSRLRPYPQTAQDQQASTVLPLTEENLLTLGGLYPAFDGGLPRPHSKTDSTNAESTCAHSYAQEELQSEFSTDSPLPKTNRLRMPSRRRILASTNCNAPWQITSQSQIQDHLPFTELETPGSQTPAALPSSIEFPRARFPTPKSHAFPLTSLQNASVPLPPQETHNVLSNFSGPVLPKRPIASPSSSASSTKPNTHSNLLLPSLLLDPDLNSIRNDGSVTLPTPNPSPLESTSEARYTSEGSHSLSGLHQQTPARNASLSTPSSISNSLTSHSNDQYASDPSSHSVIPSVDEYFTFDATIVSNLANEFRRLVPVLRKAAHFSDDAEEDWGFTGTDALNTIAAILPATTPSRVVASVFATFLQIRLFFPAAPCGSDPFATIERNDEMPEEFSEIDLDALYILNYDFPSGEGPITASNSCHCCNRSDKTLHPSCRCYASTCTRYSTKPCNKSKVDVSDVVATLTVAPAPSSETAHGISEEKEYTEDFPLMDSADGSVSATVTPRNPHTSSPSIPLPKTPVVPSSTHKQTSTKSKEPPDSWHAMVGPDFAATMDNETRRRQEAIFEVIMSERAYVKDLEVLNEVFIQPLLKASSSTLMEPLRRPQFIEKVFGNVHEIVYFHTAIANALEIRQREALVVEAIGDILLRYVPEFGFYRTYAPVTVFGKDILEKELGRTPEFQKWVEQCERHPATRKLMLDSFRQRPTQRLARYPLLLNEVIKRTSESNPDYEALLTVVDIVKEWLGQVDQLIGQAANRLKLIRIHDKLQFKTGEGVDLGLLDTGDHLDCRCKSSSSDGNGGCAGGRQLLREGMIKYRHGALGDFSELQLFLFDHVLLMARKKKISGGDFEYRVYKKPIPLELLQLCETLPAHTNLMLHDLNSSSSSFGILPQNLPGSANASFSDPTPTTPLLPSFGSSSPFYTAGFPFVINHLGRRGGQYLMSAATVADRTGWVEAICQAKERRIGGNDGLFECRVIVSDFSSDALKPGCKITCSTPYDFGRKVVLGTESGVYMGIDGDGKSFRKVIHLEKVTQIEILEEHMLLLVLADKTLISFPLDTINRTYAAAPLHSVNHSPTASKLASGVTYFNVGLCAGKTLVVHHKSKGLNSHFKALEPSLKKTEKGKRNGAGFGRLLNGGMNGEIFRVHKEFYVAAESWSVQFLRTQICVVNVRGFEIINLEELHKNKSIPDHKDESLAFSVPREKLRPLAMFTIAPGEFLLCYNEVAFVVNAAGKRRRPNFLINWEGEPNAFALHHPYVLAFDSTFIEIRHVVTGNLIQAIPAPNLRCLNSNIHALHCVQQGIKPDSQEVFKVVLKPPTEKPRCSSNLY